MCYKSFGLGFLSSIVILFGVVIGLMFTPYFQDVSFSIEQHEPIQAQIDVQLPPNQIVILPYDAKNVPSAPERPSKIPPNIFPKEEAPPAPASPPTQ